MFESDQEYIERYHLAYQRGATVCLVFALVVIAWSSAVLFRAVSTGLASGAAWVIVGLFAALLLVVQLVSLRGRIWDPRTARAQLVVQDEWTRKNWNRACRMGFAVVMWAQIPLAWTVTSLQPEPHIPAMATLTMGLGVAAFFSTYLYHSREAEYG